MIRIGLDLDNTLIDYSEAARVYSKKIGEKECNDIASLRIELRERSDLEWQKAQAWIYTEGLAYAKPAQGWTYFLQKISEFDTEIFIVSHKTQYILSKTENLDLHSYATKWLKNILKMQDIHQIRSVSFLPTRKAKIKRIASFKLQYFVDDLLEVLEDPEFPTEVRRILFNPSSNECSIASVASFYDLVEMIYGTKR